MRAEQLTHGYNKWWRVRNRCGTYQTRSMFPKQKQSNRCLHDFCNNSCCALMSQFCGSSFCVAIPPPGFQAPDDTPPLAGLYGPDVHTYDTQLPDGSVCARTFDSQRAFAIHQAAMQNQDQHSQTGLEFQLVVPNQCLFCRSVSTTFFNKTAGQCSSLSPTAQWTRKHHE